MRIRKTLDQRGPVPEIRADGDSLTFRLYVPGEAEETRLVLRCDSTGEVWASIQTVSAKDHAGR